MFSSFKATKKIKIFRPIKGRKIIFRGTTLLACPACSNPITAGAVRAYSLLDFGRMLKDVPPYSTLSALTYRRLSKTLTVFCFPSLPVNNITNHYNIDIHSCQLPYKDLSQLRFWFYFPILMFFIQVFQFIEQKYCCKY